jgi:hypothetical protein
MKKVFLLLALAAFAVSGSAQIYYYHTTPSRPWDGNKSYSLNAGLDFSLVKADFGSNASDVDVKPGFAASFRYEGDKNINERFSWGYQLELGYLTQGVEYNKTESYSSKTYHSDLSWWDLQVDMRLSLSYWFGDVVELQAAAGIFLSPFYGVKGDRWQTTAAGGEVSGTREEQKASAFNFGTGVSTMLQAKYFFNENFFLSLNAHYNIGLSFFDKEFETELARSNGGQNGIVLLGIGYKFIH